MRRISAYFISLLLIFFSSLLQALAQDTILIPLKIKIGLEVSGPAIYFSEKNILNTEGYVSVDINEKYSAVLGGGFLNYKYSQYNYEYLNKGIFILAGVDINLLKPEKSMGKYWAGIGLRYGLSRLIGYALCFLIMGAFVDKIGTKAGYAISVGLWALAQASTALAKTWIGFAFARIGLSVGQSGNFPVANKVLAEWFPKKERALAVGLFNGGSNVGTLASPLIIPVVVSAFNNDWRAAFIWTLPFSGIWILWWLVFYKKPENHKLVSQNELEYINSDSQYETTTKVSWSVLLKTREVWGICVGKFMADQSEPSSFGIQLGGMQDYEGTFSEMDESGYYWTSKEYDKNNAEYFSYLLINEMYIIDISRKEDIADIHGTEKSNKYSVRCVKN